MLYPRRSRPLSRAAIISGIGLMTLALLTQAASAAQWNTLTSSASTTSYTEWNTDRHVTTPNDTIQVQLNSGFPSGGLSWQLLDANTHVAFSATTTVNSLATVTLASQVLDTTIFHNRTKSNTTSGTFSGQEWY
jgi:hypothetical protein